MVKDTNVWCGGRHWIHWITSRKNGYVSVVVDGRTQLDAVACPQYLS